MHLITFVASVLLVAPVVADEVTEQAGLEASLALLPDPARSAEAERSWVGIQNWLEEHLADEFPVTVCGEGLSANGGTLRFDLSLSGAGYEYMTSVIAVMTQMIDAIDKFRLHQIEVNVQQVSELADGTASAQSIATETSEFDIHADFERAGRSGARLKCKVLDSVHDCRFRFDDGRDDAMQPADIPMTSCLGSRSINKSVDYAAGTDARPDNGGKPCVSPSP